MSRSLIGSARLLGCSASLVLLAALAGAQSVQEVLSSGDPFLDFTVGAFHDVAIGDDGEWFAAVTTWPEQGTPLAVIHGAQGTDGVFAPGLVDNLTGVTSTLVNEIVLADYWRTGTTIAVATGAMHGLLPGEQVSLNFLTASTGAAPADGIFAVQSVPDAFRFTVVHGTSATCGTIPLAPCGQVHLERTLQAVDLNYSRTCLPAFQGVLQMSDDGVPATAPLITPTKNDSGVFWGSTVLLREGVPSSAPEVGPGTTYTRIWRSAVDSRQDYLVLARMNDPAVEGQEDALVRLDVTEACPPELLSEQVLVRSGSPIQDTGNLRFRVFLSLEKHGFALNERGDFMYLAALKQANGLPAASSSVVLNNRSVLSDFTHVAGGDGLIVLLPLAALDLNDLGDYVVQVILQEGPPVLCPVQPPPPLEAWCTPYGEAIVRGHADSTLLPRKLVETGDPLPDTSLGLAGEIMLKVGRKTEHTDPLTTFPVLLTNGGDVVWYGEWGHLDATGAEVTVGAGIFFNQQVVVRKDQILSGPDDVLLSIGVDPHGLRSALEVSPNGRYLLFTGIRGAPDGSNQTPALFRVDLGESTPYGTVAQASGGPGCTYAYPAAKLDCTPGRTLPGSTALGDFPLLGHALQAVATSAPLGTRTALFAFTATPPGGFPCGSFVAGFPFEILLGPSSLSLRAVSYSAGSALYSQPLPASVVGLVGTDWYGQAFFLGASGSTLGATNAIRFVLGAP